MKDDNINGSVSIGKANIEASSIADNLSSDKKNEEIDERFK